MQDIIHLGSCIEFNPFPESGSIPLTLSGKQTHQNKLYLCAYVCVRACLHI